MTELKFLSKFEDARKREIFKEIKGINNPFLLEAIIIQADARLKQTKKKLNLNYKSFSPDIDSKV